MKAEAGLGDSGISSLFPSVPTQQVRPRIGEGKADPEDRAHGNGGDDEEEEEEEEHEEDLALPAGSKRKRGGAKQTDKKASRDRHLGAGAAAGRQSCRRPVCAVASSCRPVWSVARARGAC